MHRNRPVTAMSLAALVGTASLGGIVNAFVHPAPVVRAPSLGLADRADVLIIRAPTSLLAFAKGHDVASREELDGLLKTFGLSDAWYAVTTREHFLDGGSFPMTLVRHLAPGRTPFDTHRAVLRALAGSPGVAPEPRAYGDVTTDYTAARIVELPDALMREDPMQILHEMAEPEEAHPRGIGPDEAL